MNLKKICFHFNFTKYCFAELPEKTPNFYSSFFVHDFKLYIKKVNKNMAVGC